jgi:hypothetical protein
LARCPQNGEMKWNEITWNEMKWNLWWNDMTLYEMMVWNDGDMIWHDGNQKRSTATKVSLPPNYQPRFIEPGILDPEDLGRKTNWVWNWIVKCLGLGRFRGRVHCETWQWWS